MSKSPYQSVEEYIGSFDGVTHEKLTTLRSIIRETAPNAEEKLSWGVPTYYQNGFLVEFAMAKHTLDSTPRPTLLHISRRS